MKQWMVILNVKHNGGASTQRHLAMVLSFECLGCLSCVNTSKIHSKKVLSNQNHVHHLWLIAVTHALRREKPLGPTGPRGFPVGRHGYGQ